MKSVARRLLFLLLVWGLTACVVDPSGGKDLPTQTPQPEMTETSTIVWFPPTSTPTPIPTMIITPTQDLRPALGNVVLTDAFTSSTAWNTGRSAAGSIAVDGGELALAVSQPKGSLFTYRTIPLLGDFYLEIIARPSLCRGDDVYGLLFRSLSNASFYRWMISCNGQLRVERSNNYQLAILKDWTPSGQVPPGSPLVLRLGVWAVGNELRFFINDYFQFSVQDPVFSQGLMGVYARSAGETALTVGFSDLKVRSIQGFKPTSTSTITPVPSPTRRVWPTATPIRKPTLRTPTPAKTPAP
jgi:hypothetical protein